MAKHALQLHIYVPYLSKLLILDFKLWVNFIFSQMQQPDSEKGRTSRNGSSSKRAAVSSTRPSSSGEAIDGRAGKLVPSGGRISTTQRIQPGAEQKPSSVFTRAAKGTRDDPLRSFEFLSIRK